MSDEISSILESEGSKKPGFDKRITFKLIQVILSVVAVYLPLNNFGLLYKHANDLPSVYPDISSMFIFRQQFTIGVAILCIVYAVFLSGFFTILKSTESTEDDDSLDIDLRRRRFFRTNTLITKTSIIVDFFLMVLWAAVSSGFLFPISENRIPVDIQSVSCSAAINQQVRVQAPWQEICNGCHSLILIGYTLCVSFLFSSIYDIVYLNKKMFKK